MTPPIDPRVEAERAKALKEIGGCAQSVARFFLSFPILGLKATVASYFWLWFVIPVFRLPILSVAQCFGILLTISFFVPSPKLFHKDERDEADKWVALVVYVAGYLACWAIGWLVFKLVMS